MPLIEKPLNVCVCVCVCVMVCVCVCVCGVCSNFHSLNMTTSYAAHDHGVLNIQRSSKGSLLQE